MKCASNEQQSSARTPQTVKNMNYYRNEQFLKTFVYMLPQYQKHFAQIEIFISYSCFLVKCIYEFAKDRLY